MYIVIFNPDYKNPEVMTRSDNMIAEFTSEIAARKAAVEMIDGDMYVSFRVYGEVEDSKS